MIIPTSQCESIIGKKIAMWTGVRYFAIDYDNGNDNNSGYSNVSLAEAGTVAIKTLEYFKTIFPKNGNGQRAVVAIRNRASGAIYRNISNSANDDLDFLNGVYGYAQLVVRGTGTVISASATAFVNDAADKICCGSLIVSGTNVSGYNPTGTPTSSVFTCQLAGGGAASLTAEPALIGKRIRFDSATSTVALRNATSMIWANTDSEITISVNLSTAPSTSDVFYIEEPGVAVSRIICNTSGPNSHTLGGFTQSGIQIVGIKAAQTSAPSIIIRGVSALVIIAFCEADSASYSGVAISSTNDIRIGNTYTDEVIPPNTITVGPGIRAAGGTTLSNTYSSNIIHCANILYRFQMLNCFTFTIGAGCYCGQGVLFQGCGTTTGTTNLGGSTLGNLGSSSIRRFRSIGTFLGNVTVSKSSVLIWGATLTGTTSPDAVIKINGVGADLQVSDVIGSTGNTGAGLDLTNARDCRIVLENFAQNTFTATAGQDIVGAGPVYYTHADARRIDIKDQYGNRLQGSAGTFLGTPLFCSNDGNANIAQYNITRITGSRSVRAAMADTNANASGLAGVCQSAFTTVQSAMIASDGQTWIQFDAAPTIGNVAYLSHLNAGQARDTVPPVSGTNQKLRLGRIIQVSGTLGLVKLSIDNVSILSDGLA